MKAEKKRRFAGLPGFILQVLGKCSRDGIGAYAAQSAFFVLMSVFPFLMLLLQLMRFAPVSQESLLYMVDNIFPDYLLPTMHEILQELGYKTAIYAHRADERLADRVGRMGDFEAEPGNIVIYHMTTGTSFNRWVWNYPRKIVLFYHNITPARYFFGNAWGSWLKCLRGRHDLKKIAKNTFFAWGASEYSRRELEAVGVERTAVLPIVVEPETYTGRGEDESVLRYQDGRLNLLVVGRGVPHKKQDEAIEAAAWYRDNISKDIRLVIIGNIKPSYEKKLHALVRERGMEVVGVVHNGFPPADPRLDADAVAATRRQLDRLGFPPVIVRLPPVPECGPWPDVDFGELFA